MVWTQQSMSGRWKPDLRFCPRIATVYRSQVSGGPYSSVSGMLSTSTSQFADTNVFSGQQYFYVVTSIDVNGLESAASSEVGITVPTS